MLDKIKKYKHGSIFKKIGLLLGALLLTIGLGNGMNNAFAGQDAGSSLSNWFGIKRTISEQEIAEAITQEKNRLMDELKIALQEEKERAAIEMAAFTEEEKQKRITALQEYAASLKENMKTDLTEEKEAIIADLDAEYNQEIDELNKPSKPIESTPPAESGGEPISTPENEEEVEPNPNPEAGVDTEEEMDSTPTPDTPVPVTHTIQTQF